MVLNAITRVFSKPWYVLLAICISLAVFILAVWFPNLKLISSVLVSNAPFSFKIGLPISLLGSIKTNFTLLSASYTIATAILFGIDVAMVVFFLKHRISDIKQSTLATGFLGITSGLLGLGCAACGTFLFTTLFAWIGAGALIRVLPLAGGEFGILGVILLALSIYLVSKQIEDPLVCKI